LHEHTDTYLAVAVQRGPHDAPDGNEEQDGEDQRCADEDGGEDGGHDVEGRRGGVDQRGNEGGEGPVRAARTRA